MSHSQLSPVYKVTVVTDSNKITGKVKVHKWLSQIILGLKGLHVHD